MLDMLFMAPRHTSNTGQNRTPSTAPRDSTSDTIRVVHRGYLSAPSNRANELSGLPPDLVLTSGACDLAEAIFLTFLESFGNARRAQALTL